MMLQLMSSGCVEIRERALRILLLSFSNLDGKVRSILIIFQKSIKHFIDFACLFIFFIL